MRKTKNFEILRKHLQDEFLDRVNKNPAYSLRAFANHLDINDSTLSKILNGKLPITKSRAEKLSKRIPIKDINDIFAMGGKQFVELDRQKLRMLSQWYYPAILELVKTHDFKEEPKFIATRLGVSVYEVKLALEDLFDLKLLKRTASGKVLCSENNIWDGDLSEEMNRAHRNIQNQFLKKAQDSMYSISPQLKENSSLTISCDPELMPEVKKEIAKFQEYLDDFLITKSKKNKEVYQLNINFFPLTNNKERA